MNLNKSNIKAKPLIPYFGGKWKIASKIIELMPPHRVYTEVFGGAGSVLFTKRPSIVEVYNEKNSEITNLFMICRDPKKKNELQKLLRLTPYSREEWQRCMEYSDDVMEQARRTMVIYIMSRHTGKVAHRKSTSFDTSTDGHQNVARAFHDFIDNLDLICSRLAKVIIENDDALKIVQRHDRVDAVHYLDPAYLKSTRRDNQAQYHTDLSSPEYHRELANVLYDLKGYCLLSGYESALYKELFEDKGWEKFRFSATDGSAAKNKSKRIECVWVNPQTAEALLRLFI
jgi:DNA adenine methylase